MCWCRTTGFTYCARLARIVKVLGRKLTTIDYSEAQQVSAADVDKALAADPSITHVALVHCETGAGVLNPLHEVAQVVARAAGPDRGRHELVRCDRHRRQQDPV